jgi:ammonia channel protein AmtB
LAFNAGAKGSITGPGDGLILARVVMNTIISGMSAAIAAVLTKKIAQICSYAQMRHTVERKVRK